MNKVWWFFAVALGIGALLGGRWLLAARETSTRQAQAAAAAEAMRLQRSLAHTENGRREYVLEVISLGVTLDKYRQGKLWDVLQTATPYTSIREQDPKKYPWLNNDKLGTSGSRSGDTLENGAAYTLSEWGVPVFNARPPSMSDDQDGPQSPDMGLANSAVSSGMASLLFVAGPRRFAERPDRILEDVFDFFDTHPDIPYVVLNSDDDLALRELSQASGSPPLVKTGYYVPEMPDSSALLVLARRERVDPVRPFAYDDIDDLRLGVEVLNRDGVARRLYLGYLDLKKTVPRPKEPAWRTERTVTVAEWLDFAAKFAVRPDIRGTGPTSFLDREFKAKHLPPLDWKSTPWFPVPWSKTQLADFDKLPTLGFVHRPVFIKMTDEHGKPLARRDAREKALFKGLQEALHTLPEGERAKGPARVIAATNNQTEQLIALERVLHEYAAQGGPEIDSGKLDQFINIDRRLGNTGAATLFMEMAIGVMGSYRAGGPSLAINLRDPHEASLVFISPPSEEKRKSQEHARGGDVFRSIKSMAIDPANYAESTH
ncbi:type VI lipase adapter Tla3 domain-containing protein [Zemynaea arenosa]|nr:DUF2875 family protein [Massilia arenosa]